MNLIIEVIDGVAYAVAEAENRFSSCNQCAAQKKRKCDDARWCALDRTYHYRRLTAEERKELHKAIEKGKDKP